jgi:hypothetical protein
MQNSIAVGAFMNCAPTITLRQVMAGRASEAAVANTDWPGWGFPGLRGADRGDDRGETFDPG